MESTFQQKEISGFRLYALFFLRLAIGWHFLYEGISKLLIPNWTSADYLQVSGWIFAPFFHWIADTPTVLALVDWINIVGLIFVGLALMLGIFEKIGAAVGMCLLLLYWLANPPFIKLDFGVITEGHYLIVDKNIVELMAMLILFLFPTGKYLGLAHLHKNNRVKEEPEMVVAPEEKPIVKAQPEEVIQPAALDRRTLIKGLSALPVMGAFGYALHEKTKWESYEERNLVDAVTGASAKTLNIASLKELKGTIPMGKIKEVPFSKLILGGNLLSGWAHSRDLIYVSQLVKAYHQKEKIFATLLLAEKCGINTLLTNPILCSLIDEYWKRGIGKIQFISDCAGLNYDDKGASPMPINDYMDKVKKAIDTGAVACYIQGETADYYMANNKPEVIAKVMDFVRQNGLLAGIGAHKIETIKACVDAGFETDFWMKTMHHHNYWSANNPEWHDNKFDFSPEETIRYMNSLPQPVIGFKVMAAGAIHPRDGFRYAFENGADFVCAGMYDFQMVEDVNIACEILAGDLKRPIAWRG
ncbi:MAG TPA: DoxX family protein [Prolixibacteraceae bacterium]|nr:DoxX family protein [Prolixibacteraceae bacterium]